VLDGPSPQEPRPGYQREKPGEIIHPERTIPQAPVDREDSDHLKPWFFVTQKSAGSACI
jgi:hypothetical protein